eukprot:2933237-Rhodomonas_salina.3
MENSRVEVGGWKAGGGRMKVTDVFEGEFALLVAQPAALRDQLVLVARDVDRRVELQLEEPVVPAPHAIPADPKQARVTFASSLLALRKSSRDRYISEGIDMGLLSYPLSD